MIRIKYDGMYVVPSDNDIQITKTNAAISNDGSHSYNIHFDLSVKQNAEAFGAINRLQARHHGKKARIEIWSDAQLLMAGTAIVLQVDKVSIELQATEGDLSLIIQADDLTLRDLNLGPVPYYEEGDVDVKSINREEWPSKAYCYPSMLADVDEDFDDNVVVFPGTEAEPVMKAFINVPGNYGTIAGTKRKTRYLQQPYLLEVINKVFSHFGYSVDFEDFLKYGNNHVFRRLFVCARVGDAYTGPTDRVSRYNGVNYNYQQILPRWSMSEFLNQVKMFLNCEFVFDDVEMKVKVISCQQVCKEGEPYIIEDVLQGDDSFTADVENQEVKYFYDDFGYDLNRTNFNKLQDLDESIRDKCVTTDISFASDYGEDAFVIYKEEENGILTSYVKLKDKGLRRACTLQHLADGGNNLRIVPVDLPTTYVHVMNPAISGVMFGSYQFNVVRPSFWLKVELSARPVAYGIEQAVKEGLPSKEEPQRIEVAFVGATEPKYVGNSIKGYEWPFEETHSIVFPKYEDGIWAWNLHPETSKLYNLAPAAMRESHYKGTYEADMSVEYKVFFLAKKMPPVNTLFIIKGQKFVCKEITQTVYPNSGISDIYEGIFYKAK